MSHVPCPNPERTVFHVDMNAFFASVEQRCDPALRGRPIVVCGNAKTRTVVAACSYEAKAYGIKNGMPVGEAKRLCPSIVLVGGNPDKYVSIAHEIFAAMERYTPHVEVFSIDEAFLDMTHTLGRFGGVAEAAARHLKARILGVSGLTCSVGIGPNKLIAKLASDLQKPDGLVRIRREGVARTLEPLPVEELCGIGPKLALALHDLAIFTCGELGRASEAQLVAVFGVVGRALKRMGQGLDESPVAESGVTAPAKSMGHAYTLPRDTGDPATIRSLLLRLSEQVAVRLRADGVQGRTVGLTVRYTDFSTLVRHRTLAVPIDSGLRIAGSALALFTAHCEPLPQRVRLLGVSVAQLTGPERQLSLLEDDRRLERVDRCLDRVNAKFGEATLVRAGAWEPLVRKTHGFHSRKFASANFRV